MRATLHNLANFIDTNNIILTLVFIEKAIFILYVCCFIGIYTNKGQDKYHISLGKEFN